MKTKHAEIDEEVYLLDNQEEGMMLIYNALGEMLSSRKLSPNERQSNVITMSTKNKTANG